MVDVLGYYMEQIEAKIADLDAKIAEKDALIAERNTRLTKSDTNFVTYLIKDNKTNEQIKKIVHGVNDDFINKIRESLGITD